MMKVQDLTIVTQVRLGVCVFVLLVGVLAGVAWQQTKRMWQQTEELYNHPLLVRRAIGRLEADTEMMSRHVRDLFFDANDQEIELTLQNLNVAAADADRQITVLYDRYLGPRNDLVTLQHEFVKWKTLRDETIRMVRAGRKEQAEARIRPGGVQHEQGELVRKQLLVIDEFALAKGESFYQKSKDQYRASDRHLGIIAGIILLVAGGVGWLLIRRIKTPLRELTRVTDQFRQGDFRIRSSHESADEFGELSASFNAMAEAIEKQTQLDQNAGRLAEVMLREEESHAFCRALLKELLDDTGSQVAAIYFLNDAKTDFVHFESIGLCAGRRAAFSAMQTEGELGAALASGQIQRVADIPADTVMLFAAVSGDFTPREILTIPVLAGGTVVAVISLASVHAYSDAAIQLVNKIWSVLTARISGVLTHQKLHDFAQRLEYQNRELETQKRELAVQASEMAEQNAELEMQRQQLDEANRLKSAFLSNMSHELRTPLNSVIALSGVLSRRLAKVIPAEEAGYLEVIERNGRHLLELINDILNLSRIEAGREDFEFSSFRVRELVGGIVDMIAPLAREKNIALDNRIGDGLPPLHSDLTKCRHILQNLIGNSVKFTAQGSVEITARHEGGDLLIAVRDTGIGIAADQLPYIFDEFRQADDSTSRKFGGSGLGLAIAWKYARLLGGTITVESTIGIGSTFTLRLPVAVDLPSASHVERSVWADNGRGAELPPIRPGAAPEILLVEDNEPAIIQMKDILVTQGYQVRVARNGREALTQIEHGLPDAMILDLMMPEVDGFQVLREVREDERSAQLPVLILTAKHVTKEDLSFLKSNHVQQLIQKGDINKAGLLAAVARMVSPPPPQDAAPARRRRRVRPGKPLVLVVEDNPDNLRTVQALLHEHYQVVVAENGRTGIAQARQHHPDLILMDLALPELDGFGALAVIRADATLCDIPVIAVTARAMQGDREQVLARGFDGYVSKPIAYDELLKTMRTILT